MTDHDTKILADMRIGDQRQFRMLAALDTLPKQESETLRLRCPGSLPSKEIAKKFDKSGGATRVMISRALSKLHDMLSDLCSGIRNPFRGGMASEVSRRGHVFSYSTCPRGRVSATWPHIWPLKTEEVQSIEATSGRRDQSCRQSVG